MITIELPRLIGSARAGHVLIDQVRDDVDDLVGEDICISFRDTQTATQTALQALVTRLLIDEKAARILLRSASDTHYVRVVQAARIHGLGSRVFNLTADDWVIRETDMSVVCVCPVQPCECGSALRDEYLERMRSR